MIKPSFALVAFLAVAGCASAHELPISPNATLTPGAILTTDVSVICQPGYSKTVRHTSGRLKAEIYREYGIERTDGHFEVDHRVPLSLGGADAAENLWPQSRDTEPYNANLKDRLEDRIHHLVCTGRMTIEEGQAVFLSDWIAGYQKYIGEPAATGEPR